ncbi:LPXTG cell wall anchor domain-containing protein [Christensenellaceae bacterium OttesenSCG-928-K19]|nr:LPXTG cell wall anchor domain-containing protein [Christensenellaceae bacterium OttesenSCG-928-K19]
MRKRYMVISLAIIVTLVLTLVPFTALAGNEQEQPVPECVCETLCDAQGSASAVGATDGAGAAAEDSSNADCAVCVADAAQCTGIEETPPAPVLIDALADGADAITVEPGTLTEDIVFPALTAGGEPVAGVMWDCKSYDGDVVGDYVFTATLPEGYALAGGLTALEISVTVAEPQLTTQGNMQPMAVGDYNAADIALVNDIIDRSDLGWIQVAADGSQAPTNWTGATWTTAATNKRLTALNISGTTFSNITTLSITDRSDLTSLNVSNTNLTQLTCNNNTNLSTLDVSNNTALTYLQCTNNNLSTLDVSKNTALTTLYCAKNKNLSTLDVSSNTALTRLDCYNNNLSTLDLSKNTNLEVLYCQLNNLSTLDVSKNVNLTYLQCDNNNLSTLNLSKNTALDSLYCQFNNLSTLDVSNNTNLRILRCDNNGMTSLDVSSNTNLGILACNNNNLTSLDVSSNAALTSLYCAGNAIREFVAPAGKLNIASTSGVMLGDAGDDVPWDTGNFGYDVANNTVTLKITDGPDSGRTFEKWILPAGLTLNSGTETDQKISFALTGDVTLTPWFKYNVLEHPATYIGGADGATFKIDGDVQYFDKATVDGEDVGATAVAGSTIVTLPASYLKTLTSGTYAVQALFTDGYADTSLSIAYHTIAATAGANGSISPAGDVPVAIGASQAFTFTPDTGYVVDTVTVDGVAVTIANNSYTIENVQKDMTINVAFKQQPVTPAPPASGGTSPKTGDESNLSLYIMLVMMAGVGIAGVIVWRRRKAQKDV